MSTVPRLTKGLRGPGGREINQEPIKIFRERDKNREEGQENRAQASSTGTHTQQSDPWIWKWEYNGECQKCYGELSQGLKTVTVERPLTIKTKSRGNDLVKEFSFGTIKSEVAAYENLSTQGIVDNTG